MSEERFDADECRRALSLLHEPGSVFEIRIPKTQRHGVVSGFFDDPERAVQAVESLSGRVPGIYLTLNPVKSDLFARSPNRLTYHAKSTTCDGDILLRRWMPIDLDPLRKTGISATDAEHESALHLARTIRESLAARGWPVPFLADSGNGAHLCYRIDEPNDRETRTLIERCLKSLAAQFNDESVDVDKTPFNASRIFKFYGTRACKGEDTPERPHRLSRVLEVPDAGVFLERAHLEELAALTAEKTDSAPPVRSEYRGNWDLAGWIEEHHLPVIREADWNEGGRKFELNPCPFNNEHTDRSAVIVQRATGEIAFKCHHNGCSGKDWFALRDLVEPGWRDRRTWQPMRDNGRVDAAPELKLSSPISTHLETFPTSVLATPLRKLAEEGAAAIQCPPEFIGVCALTAAGAAVGASYVLELKGGWDETPALNAAVVADPGTAKTAAQKLAVEPVYDRQALLRKQYDSEQAAYDAELARFEQGKVDHKPQRPRMKRVVVSDTTVEAVSEILHHNPRGVLLCRDELSGWAQAMDAYRSGKGADRQFYLSTWSGAPCTVDRKKQDAPILLERPFVSVTGCLQPDTIRTLLHENKSDDGFVDRILFAYPAARPPGQWSEAIVSPATREAVGGLFERLYELSFCPDGPIRVKMNADAKRLWVEWYEYNQQELVEVADILRGAWAKMPSQCARLILISHLTSWAAGETPAAEVVQVQAVVQGTTLAEYFKSHVRKVLDVLGESEDDRTVRRLIEWLKRKGNPGVRPRDVLTARIPGIQKAQDTERYLAALVEAGQGEWRTTEPGLSGQKRPDRFFLLT